MVMTMKKPGGHTLPELMVALCIMAILAAVAIPSFVGTIATQRSNSAANDVYAALTRTRSEAIKRNVEATLRPNTVALWQFGWSMPNPGNAAQKLDDHAAIPSATIAGPDSVVYLPNGRIKGNSALGFNIVVAGAQRCVLIDLSGRPYQKSSAC